MQNKNSGVLSAFTLKIIACITMFLDHFGVLIFPEIPAFRIIGRLAFPIFAFFIAEGCYYTKNRLKRFLSVFLLGVICEASYLIYDGEFYGNILLTFSLSILLIYTLDELKRSLFFKSISKTIIFSSAFGVLLLTSYLIDKKIGIDYGFAGVISPLLISACDYKEGRHPEYFKHINNKPTKLLLLAFALSLTALRKTAIDCQILSLFALIPLSLYNGKIGKYKLNISFIFSIRFICFR